MAGNPADIGGTPENIVVVQVEHPQIGDDGVEQVTGAGVLDAFRLAGGAGGVEQKQRVFRVHPFGLATCLLAVDYIRPPVVAAFLHGNIMRGAF